MRIIFDFVLLSILGWIGWLLIKRPGAPAPKDLRERCPACGEPLDDEDSLMLGDGQRFCSMSCLPTVMRPGRISP
jgi:hypothetical protein